MAEIPPLADAAGLPELDDISVWLGLVAPRATPKPIIERLHGELVRTLGDPALKERSERTGSHPVTCTPEEFAAFIRSEAARWGRLIREMNLKLD